MGESDRYFNYKQKFSLGDDRNSLMTLVVINAIMFVSMFMIRIVGFLLNEENGYFETFMLPWFSLPAQVSMLLERPWTILTYMFTHTGFLTTLSNMLWLWVFGSIFQTLRGNKMLIPIYIYGGLAGAAAFIISMYSIPSFRAEVPFASMFGANAATMAVALATTTLAPDYRLFRRLNGGIPLWILTLLYVVVDFAGITTGLAANNIAHIAGAFIGFLFVFSLRKGSDWSKWMNNVYDWFINLFNPDKPKVSANRIKEKVFYKTGNQKPFVKRTNITQQRIDEILDKINVQGYHLLTEEEKNILKRAGEHL